MSDSDYQPSDPVRLGTLPPAALVAQPRAASDTLPQVPPADTSIPPVNPAVGAPVAQRDGADAPVRIGTIQYPEPTPTAGPRPFRPQEN